MKNYDAVIWGSDFARATLTVIFLYFCITKFAIKGICFAKLY